MKKYISAVLLLTLYLTLHAQSNTDTLSIFVSGICAMCEERIEATAKQVPGIIKADWDRDSKMLHITYNKYQFREKKIHKALNEAGHDTELSRASDKAYNALHTCCKYRDLVEIPSGGDGHKHNRIVEGILVEKEHDHEEVPLIGANIYWQGTQHGTITNDDGVFVIERIDGKSNLIISYLGYKNDTVNVGHIDYLKITLNRGIDIHEVIIEARRKPSSYSALDAIKIQKISAGELEKAACCDLSESFETNPNVEVNTTDAVTGTKQIEMLGLAGPYVQIMRENMPDVRGLAALNGLSYTPGPWIEGMQLNVGSGSVVNGFESMTGQINVELIKPEGGDLLFVNTYANSLGKLELNLASSVHVAEDLGTTLLFNTSNSSVPNDHNNDGFSDHPTGERYIFLNRWEYHNEKGLHSQAGVKATLDDKSGGQHSDFVQATPPDGLWQSDQSVERLEAWMKTGKSFKHTPGRSIGFQVSAVHHDEESIFGRRVYNGLQKSLYTNLIYSDKYLSDKHSYKAGLSFMADAVDEQLVTNLFSRKENIAGAFGEYIYSGHKTTLVGGLRADYHNNYGLFVTPRFNIKHQTTENLVLRATAAKGYRTANIVAENISMLASSREIIIESASNSNPYGMEQEASWNFGINALYSFQLFTHDASFSTDVYRVKFINQVVVDRELDTQEIYIYNLSGKSYTNSLQTQFDFEPLTQFEIRLAYRLNDVQTEYRDAGLKQKPLSSKHRAFGNFAYSTEKDLKFDYTINWISRKRIPNADNAGQYSTPYLLSHAQVSKAFPWGLDVYLGVENLFDFKQKNPILSAEDPYSDSFDASLIWGPVSGRKFYAGIRYRIEGRDARH